MKQTSIKRERFFVAGVCCATEEAQVRKRLDTLIGPESYNFNSVTCELSIHVDVDEHNVIKHLREAGFIARRKSELQEEVTFWQRHKDTITTVAATIFAALGLALEQLDGSVVASKSLLLVAIILGGWKVFIKGFKAAKSLSLDMNFLMSIAVIGAILIGRWGEGAAVIVLFALSLALESYSASRTRRAIQSLMNLSPNQASVLKDGKEVIVPAREISPGDTIIVRPGERVALDGIVVDGSSSVNQSPITGESIPVPKKIGATVFAGSINERGLLRVKVSRDYEDTTLARIIHLVENAQRKRAPVQTLVDKFARVYTPVVLGIAILISIVPPLVYQEQFVEWFYRALVLLVIACPCALVISTPVTIVSAITNAARHGILIKGGKHIETLSALKAIAFDKTGTLTEGKPKITDIVPLNSFPRERIIQLLAAIENRSEHHLASAVLEEADCHSISYAHIHVDDFEAIPGLGVKARIANENYYLGNHRLCEDRNYCSPVVEQTLEAFSREGKTVVIFGREKEAIAIIAIRDRTRQHSKNAINTLRDLGIRHIVMLSGDHEEAAKSLAQEIGIKEYTAGLLPEQKVNAVEDLKAQYGNVAMVGDGINDAPALAASSAGIAMGGNGTDAALETADIVLMSDDLSRLSPLLRLSRKAMSIIKQNITIALSLKLIFLVLSISGVATLWMAVLADDGAALVVILNGLRVLSMKEFT